MYLGAYGSVENGELVWKPGSPPAGVPNFTLCSFGGPNAGATVVGQPQDWLLWNYQRCPVPPGLPPCQGGTVAEQQLKAIQGLCYPSLALPQGARELLVEHHGPIDFKALWGREGRRAKLKEYIKLMQAHMAGADIPVIGQTVAAFVEHFRQNPQALSLFWNRYTRSVRGSKWSEVVKKSVSDALHEYGRFLQAAAPYILVSVLVIASIALTILSAGAAAPILAGTQPMLWGSAGIIAGGAVGSVVASQVATAMVQRELAQSLADDMRKAAADQTRLEMVMAKNVEDLLNQIAELMETLPENVSPDAVNKALSDGMRETGRKAAAAGASPEAVAAWEAFTQRVDAYINEHGTPPSQDWLLSVGGQYMDSLQAQENRALDALDRRQQAVVQTAAPALPAAKPPMGVPTTQDVMPIPSAAPVIAAGILALILFSG